MASTAVIGGGAIGGYLAAMLCDNGHETTLCVRTGFKELTLEDGTGTRTVPARVASNPDEVGEVDWIIVAVKGQDTESIAPWLKRLAGSKTRIIVAQNGVDHEARVGPMAGPATVVPSVVYIAVERTEPGHVVHHGSSRMIVQKGENGDAVAALFAGTALNVEQSPDFTTVAWRKLLSNVVANPITALTMRRMEVFSNPKIHDLAVRILDEALEVAQAEGARLTQEDTGTIADRLAASDSSGGSSMLYDRLSGHSLEHGSLTGAVVEAAARHGIDVPLNRAIFALLDGLDKATEHSPT